MSKSSFKVSEEPKRMSFSLIKYSEGWSAVKITTQGDKVLSTEQLNQPDMRGSAIERLKIEIQRQLLNE